MLRKLLRALVGWTARGVALLVVLALLLPVAAILYTTTDDFRARLLAYAVPELDRRMGGDLSVGGLEGSPLTALRLEDVSLVWHGDEIVHVPAATVALDWSALLLGEIRIARIELEAPRVLFEQDAEHGGDWRLALAPLVPAPDAHHEPRPDPLPLVIESLALTQATLRVERLGHEPLELAGLALRARIDFGAKKLDVEHAGLALGSSKLEAKGGLDFAGHSEFAITVESLAPRDLASLSPALAKPLDFLAPADGALTLRGDKAALALEGELDWPDAALVFDASARVDRPLLDEAKVEAKLDVKDLPRFMPGSPVVGQLMARIALDHGAGTLDALLRPGAAARADRRSAPGTLAAKGSFRLGDVPEAKLDLVATDFDPARAFPGHPEWAGALTARGSLDARGRDRATLAASLAFELGKSRIGGWRIDRGGVKAKVEGERIDLAELSLESPIGNARVSGRASTTTSGALALKSRIDVANLAPLLALAKQQGRGSLTARLDVAGSIADPRVEGEAAGTRLRVGGVELERASLRLRAKRARDRSLEGVLESMALVSKLGAWRLERAAAFHLANEGLSVASASFASDDARLRLDGRLGRRGPQDFKLTAHALPIAEWARQFPERVPPDLLTRGVLDLELAVRGTAADPTLDLALHPRALVVADQPIDSLEATLRQAERRARATVHARTEPSLRLDAEAELPFALAWAKGFVAKPTGELVAKVDGEADDLSLLEPFVARTVENLGGRARAHLELEGPLDALRPKGLVTASELTARPRRTGVTIVQGELEVELAADRFRVRRATATVARHETTARFRAEGEGPLPVFLTRLGQGPLATTAPTTFLADYTTKIEIEQWPLVETRRDQLFASGVMRARGSFEAPHVEGELEIVKGTLRPNLAFLSSGPPPRDPTIELEPDPALADAGAASASGTNGAAAGTSTTAASRFEALELAVDVDLGRELWIKHEQAEVLLSGRVLVRKDAAKPVTLDGRIDAQRGFADLQGRRFRLMEGALEFVPGAKIDPLLDVLGRYKAPAHTIDARLTGTASKPILTLTADPTLSQEDILAVLLFGRPASELSQQQQTSLGQRAEQMASAFGMTAVGRSLASAIGLEELGLQIEEISSTRAAIGAYVGRNIFVALAQEFSGERGQELSIEYEFLPGWSLVGSTTSQGTNAADLVWKIRY